MQDYQDLIDSDRVSPQTRAVLQKRGKSDDADYVPLALSIGELQTLRAVLTRVIPQASAAGEPPIDLGARIDTQLATTKGDGWRYATLPVDIEAYRIALRLLEEFARKLSATPFERLEPEAQDALLTSIAAGRLRSATFDLQRWFEDLRSDAVRAYVAHPRTLAHMGYSGIADDQNGFVQLGIGQREAWEPEAQ